MSGTQRVETWVDEVAGLTQPNKIAWADGSKAEYDRLIDDMAPAEGKEKVGGLLRGSMRGRTMWVIPYLMGPAGSSMSRVGVMVTDSAYVVASMHIMTRVGSIALEHMRDADDFVRGLHSLGDLSPDRRFILHFPEERLIWSVGSGYGGNALLGKKCHALRIASSQARQEGWPSTC
jgi:phosphoenolpyruvate carboxykinase (GTP)